MKASWRFFVVTIFLAGFLVTGLMGTSTSMSFIWPGYTLLGLAGAVAIGLLWKDVGFSMPKWTTFLIFGFAGYLIIRACDSPVDYFAREDAALVIAAFLCYALFLSVVTVQRWRQALVYSLAALVIVNLGYAICQSLFNPAMWLIPGYERTVPEQVGGLFNHPEHFTAFIAVTTPLWLSIAAFGRHERVVKTAWGGLAALCIVTVLLTGNVIGLLTLGSGIVVFCAMGGMIIWPNLSAQGKGRVLAAAGAAAVVAASGLTLKAVFAGKDLEGGVSVSTRGDLLPIWEAGVKQASQAPVFGTGSRTSYLYGRSFRSESLDVGVTEPEFVHNEFLQMFADYGVVGLFFLLAVLMFHFMNGFGFVRAYVGFRPPPGRVAPQSDHLGLALGALAALSAMVFLSMFDFAMHLPIFAIMAAVLMAVLAVPDPMASALKNDRKYLVPGGPLMFANRAVAFGCGIAMMLFGATFSRSEFNYELARLAFEADSSNFKQFRHLKAARELDPKNPFAFSLSAHAQVAGITPDLKPQVRKHVLESADRYFSHARTLYPQDIFAAVGHAAVLDELGWKDRAGRLLQEAREQAPLYGNLMLAEAEHYLRHGQIHEAEESFRAAEVAPAFRDATAAREGLRAISEWRTIAMQNGLPVGNPEAPIDQRIVREAKVEERVVAGDIPAPPASDE